MKISHQTIRPRQTALITGAGRGIGLAIAKRLSPKYQLILVTKTESSARLLREICPTSFVYTLDLTKKNEIIDLVRRIKKTIHHLDVLVNNAGIYYAGTFEKITDQQLDEMYKLHIKVPLFFIRELFPLLKKSSQKQVVNISSAANVARLPTEGAYTATKAGLTALGDVLQLELQRHGIRLSTIHPWSVNTKNFPDGLDFLQPDDIADIVEFILSRDKNVQILNVEASGTKDWRGAWPPWVKKGK